MRASVQNALTKVIFKITINRRSRARLTGQHSFGITFKIVAHAHVCVYAQRTSAPQHRRRW